MERIEQMKKWNKKKMKQWMNLKIELRGKQRRKKMVETSARARARRKANGKNGM